jgi:hypothetical protein
LPLERGLLPAVIALVKTISCRPEGTPFLRSLAQKRKTKDGKVATLPKAEAWWTASRQ